MPRKATRKPPASRSKAAKRSGANPAKSLPQAFPSAAESAYERIAVALEAIAANVPGASASHRSGNPLGGAEAFVWHPAGRLIAVPRVSRVELSLLKGIDRMRDILTENTERFATGLPANNALLWGARGMGKSSLVKAVHASVNQRGDVAGNLKLIEIHREDIESLPALMTLLRGASERVIVFCDDLSFDGNDASYKSLKAVLEGGIEGRPDNVILYATSNRRHLLPRDMIENERSTAINPAEAVEERVSMSDRFGLWLGFHSLDQDTYHAIVQGYAERYGLDLPLDQLKSEASEWSITRGSRSGRVAWQFIQDLAGRLGKALA